MGFMSYDWLWQPLSGAVCSTTFGLMSVGLWSYKTNENKQNLFWYCIWIIDTFYDFWIPWYIQTYLNVTLATDQKLPQIIFVKLKRFKKTTCIQYHQLQWKFKLLAGKFTGGNKAKYCWVMSTNIFVLKSLSTMPSNVLSLHPSKLSCP